MHEHTIEVSDNWSMYKIEVIVVNVDIFTVIYAVGLAIK